LKSIRRDSRAGERASPRSHADPWALREADYPARGSRFERLRFLLRYAILAPSNRNTQPWGFTIGRDQISLHSERSRWQRVSDPHARELHVSLGCALENLLIALEHFGFGHHVTLSPDAFDSSIAAQIAILDRPAASPFRPASLFKAIVRRRTNHGRYRKRSVSLAVIRGLMECHADGDLTLLLTDNAAIKRAAQKLMLRGEALGLSDPKYREELAESIGSGNFGGPWLLSVAQQFAITHLGMRTADARGDHKALSTSPLFGLIGGATGGEAAQIRAGQLLERLYLAATSQGLSLQPVSQLLEVDEVRTKFAKLFRAGGVPLVAFRLGYADPPANPTPRRPLEELLR
jgi:nitroreductase